MLRNNFLTESPSDATIDAASDGGAPQRQADISEAFQPALFPSQDAFSPVEPHPLEDAASELLQVPPDPVYKDEEDVSNPIWWTNIPQAARLALLVNNAKLKSKRTTEEVLQEYASRLQQTEDFFESKLQEVIQIFDKAFNRPHPQRQKPKLDNVDLLGLVVGALAGAPIGDATKMILDKKEEEADRQYQLDLARFEIESRSAKEKANLMLSLLQRRAESMKDVLGAQMKAALAGIDKEERRELLKEEKNIKALSMLLAAEGPEEAALVVEAFGLDANNAVVKKLLERKAEIQKKKDLAFEQEADRISIELGLAKEQLEHKRALLPIEQELKQLALEAARVGLTADKLNKDILQARMKYIDRELAAQTGMAELEYQIMRKRLELGFAETGSQETTAQNRLLLNSSFKALDDLLKRNEEELAQKAKKIKDSLPSTWFISKVPKLIELKKLEDNIKKIRDYRDNLTLDYVGALGGKLQIPGVGESWKQFTSPESPPPQPSTEQKGQKGITKGKTPSGFEYQYKTSGTEEMSLAAPFADTVAAKFKGKPYIWGGITERGVDCSGLVMQYANFMGIRFPYRFTTAELYKNEMGWIPVERNRLAKGDIVVYRSGGKGHTAIYMGQGKVLDASSANKKVVERSFAAAFGNRRNLRFYRPPLGVA